jgi:hypothetical protein
VTSPFDTDELLWSANPVDESRLFAPAESASAQRLFEKITGVAYQPAPRPPDRRRWRAYVTSVLAAVAIGGGVAYAVTYGQATKNLNVGCYAQASLQGVVSAVPSHGGDPVGVCRKAWIAGQVGPGGPPPSLVACVLPSGQAGVFPATGPADDVCGRLGLAPIGGPAIGSPPTSVPAVFALRDRVVAALQHSCLGGPQAVDLVQTELRRAGLTGWTVTIATPFTPARPCASPAFDEPGQRVLIVPIPPANQG